MIMHPLPICLPLAPFRPTYCNVTELTTFKGRAQFTLRGGKTLPLLFTPLTSEAAVDLSNWRVVLDSRPLDWGQEEQNGLIMPKYPEKVNRTTVTITAMEVILTGTFDVKNTDLRIVAPRVLITEVTTLNLYPPVGCLLLQSPFALAESDFLIDGNVTSVTDVTPVKPGDDVHTCGLSLPSRTHLSTGPKSSVRVTTFSAHRDASITIGREWSSALLMTPDHHTMSFTLNSAVALDGSRGLLFEILGLLALPNPGASTVGYVSDIYVSSPKAVDRMDEAGVTTTKVVLAAGEVIGRYRMQFSGAGLLAIPSDEQVRSLRMGSMRALSEMRRSQEIVNQSALIVTSARSSSSNSTNGTMLSSSPSPIGVKSDVALSVYQDMYIDTSGTWRVHIVEGSTIQVNLLPGVSSRSEAGLASNVTGSSSSISNSGSSSSNSSSNSSSSGNSDSNISSSSSSSVDANVATSAGASSRDIRTSEYNSSGTSIDLGDSLTSPTLYLSGSSELQLDGAIAVLKGSLWIVQTGFSASATSHISVAVHTYAKISGVATSFAETSTCAMLGTASIDGELNVNQQVCTGANTTSVTGAGVVSCLRGSVSLSRLSPAEAWTQYLDTCVGPLPTPCDNIAAPDGGPILIQVGAYLPIAVPRCPNSTHLRRDDRSVSWPLGLEVEKNGYTIGGRPLLPTDARHISVFPVNARGNGVPFTVYIQVIDYVCPAGSYCPAKEAQPIKCPIGSYCPENSYQPKPCVQGYVCPVGSTEPTLCPPGFACADPKLDPVPCTEQGSYCTAGSIFELPCPKGHACGSITSLQVCNLTQYCPERSTRAAPCDEHFYCPDSTTKKECTELGTRCPFGSVQPLLCTSHRPGYYCDGSADFVECPASYWCPSNKERYPCKAGHRCPVRSSAMTPCPKGSHVAEDLATECLPCSLGYEARGVGMTECTICPAGSYAAVVGSKECTPCGSGFNSIAGAVSSSQCVGSDPVKSAINQILISIPAIGGSLMLFILGMWLKRRQDNRSWLRFSGYSIANQVRT